MKSNYLVDSVYEELAKVWTMRKTFLFVSNADLTNHLLQTVFKMKLGLITCDGGIVAYHRGHAVENFLLGKSDRLIVQKENLEECSKVFEKLGIGIIVADKPDCNKSWHITRKEMSSC